MLLGGRLLTLFQGSSFYVCSAVFFRLLLRALLVRLFDNFQVSGVVSSPRMPVQLRGTLWEQMQFFLQNERWHEPENSLCFHRLS